MISSEAAEVHAAAPLVDLHCDSVLRWRYLRRDLSRRGSPSRLPGRAGLGHADLPRLRDGGVAVAVLGLPAPVTDAIAGPGVAEQLISAAHAAMATDGLTRILAAEEDPAHAKSRGELRVVFGIEGAHLVGFDLSVLASWRALGLRMVGPAHLVANVACQPSSRPSKADVPLSAYGRSLVEAIDAHGLVLDLAHMNRAGFVEALRLHRGPVLVSHTGVGSAHELWRNVTPEQARAVADRDGVIGIILFPAFLRAGLFGSVEDVVDHVKAAIGLVGVEHVAIGTDLDGGITLPAPMRDASDLPALTDA
ncbi:MAG TPA: membrane dipeptidase, partial [Actinomycetota bacterium]|nr:membrane dipeptidase [Actinomycetota bacterium]